MFCSTAEGQYPEVKKSRRPSRRQVLSGGQAANKVEGIGPGGLNPSPHWCPSLCLPEKAWEEMHRGKGLEWREMVMWTQDTFHVDMEGGSLPKLTLASTSQVHEGRNL